MVNYEAIGKKWIHPKTGEVRYYINGAWKYGGLELEFHKSSYIKNAVLDGEQISNREGGRLVSAIEKCWITETGDVYVIGDSYHHGEFIEAVKKGVKKEIAILEEYERKMRPKTGKFQIIPCDRDGGIDINEDGERFDTIEDFKDGIRRWASEGWVFSGLHPWHMGKNLDLVYVKRVV